MEKGSGRPCTASYVNDFRVVGSAGNFMIRKRFNVTIRPDGTTAALIDYEDVDCK